MRVSQVRIAALALASGLTLSGCAYGMYGDDFGYGYSPYGYGYPSSRVSIGIGYGSGYGGYGYPYGGYYGSFGYPYGGYGYDPFGWYGDYYYPGTGIYVYDSYRNRHVWNDDQRRYWERRRSTWQTRSGHSWSGSENWVGWNRSHGHVTDTASVASTETDGDRSRGGWRNRSSANSTGERSRGADPEHRGRAHRDDRPE